MSIKKVVVLISGSGSNLQALMDKLHQQQINEQQVEVVAVISNKADAYGLQRATDANIPAILVESKGVASREEYDALLAAELDKLQPDLILLAGFMRILTPDFVNQYQGKMLNIHPSLLPKYPGVNTHQRAIDAGDKEHGATVHFVTPELDSGPTVLQAKVPIFTEDSAQDLAERVLTQEHQIYALAASWFISDRLTMQGQYAFLDGQQLTEFGYAAD
ncbi:phosphoribosylglycinamide formyltransferase [Psychromonas sp. 14N.309.X.WAT.B.A12]|uniref:phosphoribosylglycinamide formyltransferase n=1 Tax=unclassified Psychromonas TaxID=2614957 RepID=UPI0025AFB713|nr:phosphoribosylglycinamide formyltransferase [Psychromonas sp. 14N.309.X.WAT.B.A12]MDN2662448.1 phosphoribosylglycinamide formyltransferase [Psychromonas sp. 14N.309.X.WAT.B.A12]